MRSTGESEVSCNTFAVVLSMEINEINFNVIPIYTTFHDKQQLTECLYSLACYFSDSSAEYKVSPKNTAIIKQTQSVSSSSDQKPKKR